MENAGWILVVSLALQLFIASSLDMLNWYNIDCGAEKFHSGDDLIMWEVDKFFTQTGTNQLVQINHQLQEMNTLRFFPNNTDQNCYIVPAYSQTLRYIVRAGFYYGNYDTLSKFPTFDLYMDDKKWATVNTSWNGGKPVYHEAIYVTHGSGYFKICVKQTRDGEVPFISLIQVVPLWANLYPRMETNATFHLITRTNLGGDEIRFAGLSSDEMYNRIWTKGTTPSNCINVQTIPDMTTFIENNPPYSMFSDSIQSKNSDPIILTVDLPQTTLLPAYFVFYLAENTPLDYSRTMQIKINGQDEEIVTAPSFGKIEVVTIYPVMVVGPTINITLEPTNNIALPPLIAGMEVFVKKTEDEKLNSSRTRYCFSFALNMLLSLVAVMMA